MTLAQHRIPRNDKTGGYPRYVCFVDTETDHDPIPGGVINVLSGGVAEFWQRTEDNSYTPLCDPIVFRSKAEFILELLSQCKGHNDGRKFWVFAHNMDFDYQVLDITAQFTKLGWSVDTAILEAPPFLVKLVKGGRNHVGKGHEYRQSISFVDSMNWFRTSLSELAKPLGMTKGEDAGPGAPWEQREAYCRNDVAILREAIFAWLRFCHTHDLGMFTISQASQALGAFRHRFMQMDIFVNHDEEVAAHERAGYFGARTEMLWRGTLRNAAHLDVNSLYPSVMRGGLFPVKLISQRSGGTVFSLLSTLAQGNGIVATVKLDTDVPWYPVRGERITFPTGKFWTTLCTPELQRALDHGHVIDVGRVQVYEMGEIFTEFVDFFYGLRLQYKAEGNEPFQYMCKIFMNSLYGKFGQMTPEWIVVEDEDRAETLRSIIPPDTGRFTIADSKGVATMYRRIGDRVEEKVGRREAYNAFCAIAAHVTSAARMVLLDGMIQCGWDNVWYVDTDSIFCTQEGKELMMNVIDPGRLGAWKDEGDVKEFTVYGAKDYIMDGVARRKGVRKNAQEYAYIIDGELIEGVFAQEMFVSYTGAMGKGHAGEQRVMGIAKRLSRDYRKGTVGLSGKVTPILMVDTG